MKTLFVGGSWDKKGGRKSGLSEKMYKCIEQKDIDEKITYYNGGNYDDLENILNTAKEYDVIYWMAYVPNDLPKVRDVKKINPYAVVIGSKRNDNNKYSFVEILNRALLQRHNLTVEFSKKDDRFNMLIFDPLGTAWYNGDNLEDMVNALYNRIKFILTTRREHTYKTDKKISIPNDNSFFEYVRQCAKIFQDTIEHAPGVTRFLGNGSFISDDRKYVYVTQRDVDKCFIDIDHFVGTYKKDGKVYYSGDVKPSKDTIVQSVLYEKLKNVKYIIHSHCYVKDTLFTNVPVPCGALDEVDEVMQVIEKDYDGNYNLDYYAINLKGHGCLIMGQDIKKLRKTNFLTRHLPEKL